MLLPRYEHVALPTMFHFFGKKAMTDDIFCSLGLVSRPTNVRRLSLMSSEGSKSGALILIRGLSRVLEATPLPFSSAENLFIVS